MTSRPSTAAPILAVLAVGILCLLTIYAGSYFLLGTAGFKEFEGKLLVDRHYTTRWEALIFEPGGRCESWLTGRVVMILPVS